MEIAGTIINKQDRDGMLRRSLERIIQLYTDKSHFVYELLQNAEDACATEIKFIQYEDRLVVMHNGKPFTISNLQGLCDIGKSDKTNDLNQIGEFGVGFKSVFGICENVFLYSKPPKNMLSKECFPFSVEIQDFTKPVDVSPIEFDEKYTTMFVFPYSVGFKFSGYKTIETLIKQVSSRISNLGVTTLLFMHNLQYIEYEIYVNGEKKSGTYGLEKKTLKNKCELVSAMEADDKTSDSLSFLKFSRKIDADNSNRTVDIAFPVRINEKNEYTFQKASDPYISVYFPTETESKLDFIVQGPYRTTPNRSSVPVDDPENEQLVSITAELLKQSILELRDLGLLNLSLLNILPIDEDAFYYRSSALFKPLYDEVWKLFRKERVIPAGFGDCVRAKEALLARKKELPKIFTDSVVTELINDGGKHYWLNTDITENNQKYKKIFNYLTKEMDIDYLRPEDIGFYIKSNTKFLTKRSDAWISDMYRLFENIPEMFTERAGNLLEVPLVKTESGKFIAPYRKQGTKYITNVFLPSNKELKGDIEYVNRDLYKINLGFFETTLRLQKPDEYELLIQHLKNTYKKLEIIDEKQYFLDLARIEFYIRNLEYCDDIKEIAKEYFVLKCRNNDKIIYLRPFSDEQILFPQSDDGLQYEAYYKNIKDDNGDFATFIEQEYYLVNGINYEMLKNFDVVDTIYDVIDKDIQLIEKVLCYIEKHPKAQDSLLKSQTIFKILQKYESEFDYGEIWYLKPDVISTLTGEIYAFRGTSWGGKWLYTESDELVSQKSISKYDLNTAIYGKIRFDSKLYEILEFKKKQVDEVEAVIKEYEEIPKDRRESYFNLELQRRYGITVEDLDNTYSRGDIEINEEQEDYFEFPRGNVKNWDALRKHAAQVLSYSNPVKYDWVVRSIRVSKPSDNRAYLMNMYRVNNEYRYACQMCHLPSTSIEACQLEKKPEDELDPMHLCLCPNCASKYRKLRENGVFENRMKNEILSLDDEEIVDSEYVSIQAEINDIWFTQIHIAEIRELITLKQEAKNEKNVASKVNDNSDDTADSELNVYSEFIGKRVFHKKKKSYAKVVSCDGNQIVLRFETGENAGEDKKYSLKACLEWLTVEE